MKKKLLTILMMGLVLIFIFGVTGGGGTAHAKEFLLSFVGSPSGTTLLGSSTTQFVVNGGVTYIRPVEIQTMKSPVCFMQIASVLFDSGAGVTTASSEWPKTDDMSGLTMTVRYKESLNLDMMPYAETTNIWNAMALDSSDSPYQVQFYPTASGYLTFEYVSGATPISDANFIIKIIEDE